MESIVQSQFPILPNFAFAYGSGVFEQIEERGFTDTEVEKVETAPMIDFIFAVDDPIRWHSANLERNSSHYSLLKYAGSAAVANIQEEFGANIYFNTLVDIPEYNRKIKYGVISTKSLCRDLETWDTLYVSGRLHKPVRMLVDPHGVHKQRLKDGLELNLKNALNVSLFLLPETFSKFELFETIVGLSYTGDMRVGVAENPNKVQNIVRGSFDRLEKLYKGVDPTLFDTGGDILHQDMSDIARSKLLDSLPLNYSRRSAQALERKELLERLHKTVSASSRTQTIKGLVTAGFSKSTVYALQKIKKAMVK
mmetsp:Transcript_13887/g.15824  ORF Transcript_13887/g.15824 Transcript_13887/m.15824 type:complete len:309 (-) Transcript_13887:1394-2320(-)